MVLAMFRRKKEKQKENHNPLKVTFTLDGICTIHLKTTVSSLRESVEFESSRLQRALRDPVMLKKLPKEDYRSWEEKQKHTVARNSEKENW